MSDRYVYPGDAHAIAKVAEALKVPIIPTQLRRIEPYAKITSLVAQASTLPPAEGLKVLAAAEAPHQLLHAAAIVAAEVLDEVSAALKAQLPPAADEPAEEPAP